MKDVHRGPGGVFILLLLSNLNSNIQFLNTLNREEQQILTFNKQRLFVFFFAWKAHFCDYWIPAED